MAQSLIAVHVHVNVLPDHVGAFRAASIENGRASVKEAGIVRFDVVQDISNPAVFVLVEVYRTEEAIAAHKKTPHYAAWRDAVAPMMAEPRTSLRYVNVFPDDAGF
jgi:(4S)-4-hydroxy-5-phosphonooxypentane-2,3-dione isomerase